jgi:formamidopyrimidine-DNA glycosylase
MPELPEVETVRRGLESALVGRRIERVEQRRADLRFPLPSGFARRLAGTTVLALGRRAKYLLWRLSSGETLISHLGMSGRFDIAAPAGVRQRPGAFVHDAGAGGAHDHIVLHIEGGTRVTYHDPRRFGMMDLVADADVEGHRLLRALGVEPTGNELSAAHLAAAARRRQCDLKAFLMDQGVVAGLGNIYVSEALFRAGLSPLRHARSLVAAGGGPTTRAERLAPAIRGVIADAIAAGGSSLRDYRQADGTLGYFQHVFSVYDRAGKPCARRGCAGTVTRLVQSGRSTYRCPACQR